MIRQERGVGPTLDTMKVVMVASSRLIWSAHSR